MGPDVQVMRQWKLLRSLAARTMGVSLADLAREFEVNERTINRDLEQLQQRGFPLTADLGARGTKSWKLDLVPGMTFAGAGGRRVLDRLSAPFLHKASGGGDCAARGEAVDQICPAARWEFRAAWSVLPEHRRSQR